MIHTPSSDQVYPPLATSAIIEPSNVQKKSDPLITFLFKEIILKLIDQLKLVPITQEEYTMEIEKVVRQSCFYSLLKGINSQQVPLKMKILHSVILKIKECTSTSEDQDMIYNVMLACFRLLSRDGDWRSIDATIFFEKLYQLHSQNYGNKKVTRALELIDEGSAVGCLSPKSQKFMDEVTYHDQFDPITDHLVKFGTDVTDEKTGTIIANIANKFFTKAVKISYFVMSRNVYDFPLLQYATPLMGMHEFRQITIRNKYMYMRVLRESHLSCVAKAKRKSLIPENSMIVIEKKAVFFNQACTVSFAVASEEKKATIKAITISCDQPLDSTRPTHRSDSETSNADVYFFVQELIEENPRIHPNPAIPLSERPLYKFELIPNSHFIRLQKVPEQVRKKIIKLITEIEEELTKENNMTFECAVHMAIWHHEELMLVEIIRQVGSMLSSRALYGAIRTYVKKLTPSRVGHLSDPSDFKEFKKQLEEILIAAYVLVTNEYLSSWYQDDLLKPMLTESAPSIQETHGMKIIKERTFEVFKTHKQPGKWLLKSIMSCGYDGNPAALAPLNIILVNEPNKRTCQFEECKELLQAALGVEEEQEKVLLPLVNAMVKGLLSIMQRSKKKEAVADLVQYFKSVEGFPLKMIQEIMLAPETSKQKAARLIYLFLSPNSLNLKATEEQQSIIKTFLEINE